MPYFELQPGPAVGLDAYIKAGSYQDSNFGYESTLQLGRANNLWVFTLMKFLVLESEGGDLPAGCTINSAILKLYQWSHTGIVNTISSYLMIRAWSKTRCSWNHATRLSVPWEIPGAKGITDREQISDDPTTLCNSGTTNTWVEFTLTRLFQKIVNNYSNAGFILIGINSPKTQHWGSDYTSDPAKRPILCIDYSVFDPFPVKSKFLRLNFP